MKRKATEQKQAMIEALKPRYYVLEWDGGYNLYDTTKPAKQTQVGENIDEPCFDKTFWAYDIYQNCIDCIEWLIKEGYFNKEYLV